GIAAPAPPTPRHHHRVSRLHQVAQNLTPLRVPHHRPRRNVEHKVTTGAPRAVRALTVLPALRLVVLAIAVVQERAELRVGLDHHIAALAAAAARGAAPRHTLLAAERLRPRAARPGHHLD